jgi:hypothetical protein
MPKRSAPTPSQTTPPEKSRATDDPDAVSARISTMTDDIKKTLEYQIAGKTATVVVKGKTLTMKKWGLRKRISLGAKVGGIILRVQTLLPPDREAVTEERLAAVVQAALGAFISEVVEIIGNSIEDPFVSLAEAIEWLDDTCEVTDLMNLAVIVYDMNLAGDGLKNLTTGLDQVVDLVQSRLLKK